MSAIVKLVFSVLVVVALVVWSVGPARFQIVGPRLGIPAIVTPGQSVAVEIETSLPYWCPPWRVSLMLRDQRHEITLSTQEREFNRHDLRFEVPATLEPGAYSLVVSAGDIEVVRPKAVHVVKGFARQLSIVQMADLPTLGGNGQGDQHLYELIHEINIINPDLVFMTGDVAYGGSWDQYRRLLKAMESINAPVIAAPGNHEYEGWAGYLTLLGTPYHSVSFGPFQIISLNSSHGRDQLTESQYAWLTETLARIEDRVPVVQIHHPYHHRPGLRGYVANHVDDSVAAFGEAGVPIVVSGHWHGDAVYDETGQERRDTWDFGGVAYVATTTAGADLRQDYATSPMHHGYRLIRLDGSKRVSYTYDWDGDGERHATSSIPMGQLRARQISPTQLVVENELNESFDRARVAIRVPGANLALSPDQGNVVARYLDANDAVYAIELPLPAKSRRVITLFPGDPRP